MKIKETLINKQEEIRKVYRIILVDRETGHDIVRDYDLSIVDNSFLAKEIMDMKESLDKMDKSKILFK